MKTRPLLLLASLLAIAVINTGCAHSPRSTPAPVDLSGIIKTARLVEDDIKAGKSKEALAGTNSLVKLAEQKQAEAIAAAIREGKANDRLNYVEPKYNEAVGLLWKWRLIAATGWGLLILQFVWKFRRWFGVALCIPFLMVGCGDADLPNDCLIDAIQFNQVVASKKRLDDGSVWNDILIVKYTSQGRLYGHCYSIFKWEGKVWAWDQDGSRVVRHSVDDPIGIGKELQPTAVYSYWSRSQTP